VLKKTGLKKFLITVLLLAAPLAAAAYSDGAVSGGEYDFAYELYMDGNFKLSENIFRSYILNNPGSKLAGDAHFMAAENLYNTGNYRKSLNEYIGIIEKYPETKNKHRKELYYRIAEAYFQIKDYENSAKYVKMVIQDYPESYLVKDACLLLGENLFLTGDYDGAIDALNRLENYTEYGHFDYVYYLTGRVYYEKSIIEKKQKKKLANEAIRFFDRVKKEFSGSKIINHSEFRKANVYYSLGKYSKSARIINMIIEKEDDGKFALLMRYFLAWNYYMMKEYEKAIQEYSKIIEGFEDDILRIWAEYKTGLCYEGMGEADKAVSQLEKVIKEFPETIPSAYARYAMAQHHYDRGELYDSLRWYSGVVDNYDIEELTRSSLFMMADIYLNLGKFIKAREIYEKLENESEQDKYNARYMKAWCLAKSGEYTNSTEVYDSLIEDEGAPEELKARALLKKGDNFYELGLYEDAEKHYNGVITGYKNFKDLASEARYAKGWIYYRKNDFKKARDIFTGIIGSAKSAEIRIRADFMVANTLFSMQDFDKALSIYSGIMNDRRAGKNIKNESVYYTGWCYYRKGKFDLAVSFWEKYVAAVKDPVKKAEAYYRIGWAFFRKNEFDKAIEKFGIILRDYTGTHFYQEALLKTGDSYYNKQEYRKAVEFYRQLVDRFPSHYRISEALYGIQWSFYQLGEHEKAIELSKQFVEKYPESSFTPEIQYRVAEHYYNVKKYETAVSEFNKFISKYPEHDLADNAYYWKGTCELSLRNYSDSINTFRELTEKFPSTPFAGRAVFKAANAYYKLHEYGKAIENYLLYMEKYKDKKSADNACFNIAMSYKRMDNFEETEKWYKKFREEYKDSELFERATMNLGYLYQDTKRYDEAAGIFGEAVKLGNDKAVEAQFWIGDCLYAKKDYAGAAAAYKKVYTNFKKDELWAVSAIDSEAKIYEKQGKLKKAIAVYKNVFKVTKNKKYTDVAAKKIELLEEQYRILNPAPAATAAGKGGAK